MVKEKKGRLIFPERQKKMESGKIKTKDALTQQIKVLVERLKSGNEQITSQDLLDLCRQLTGSLFETDDPHIFHEIAETALNVVIQTNYAKDLLLSIDPVKKVREIIKPLTKVLPTQTWRSPAQIKFQQFSTPPAIAYLMVYFLSLNNHNTILEPSAGTGCLGIWAKSIGAKVLTNEIDGRRRELLQQLGFTPTAFDAEYIHDFLAPEIEVDVVLMNPPFSANGGRTKNSSKYGFRHVSSALERIKKGGRFAVLLGEAGGLDTKTGKNFWGKMVERFDVKANLKLSGKEYYKNGTTVDINLIFGEKLIKSRQINQINAVNQIPFFRVRSVEKAFETIETYNLRFK